MKKLNKETLVSLLLSIYEKDAEDSIKQALKDLKEGNQDDEVSFLYNLEELLVHIHNGVEKGLELDTKVSQLESKNTSLESNVEDLKSHVSELEGEIKSLKERKSDFNHYQESIELLFRMIDDPSSIMPIDILNKDEFWTKYRAYREDEFELE
jgi:predicted nuclease with TOPRIM domain